MPFSLGNPIKMYYLCNIEKEWRMTNDKWRPPSPLKGSVGNDEWWMTRTWNLSPLNFLNCATAPETWNLKLETWILKLETWNLKLETWNLNLETCIFMISNKIYSAKIQKISLFTAKKWIFQHIWNKKDRFMLHKKMSN